VARKREGKEQETGKRKGKLRRVEVFDQNSAAVFKVQESKISCG